MTVSNHYGVTALHNLSVIEYNVLMQAINNAKDEIANDTFIDPYNNEEGYTNETLLKALDGVEKYIIEANIPF